LKGSKKNMSLPIADVPTCGVIVEKDLDTQEEKVCGAPATQLVSMVDPETRTIVTAVLLLCDRHDKEMEEGKPLIFPSDDGTSRMAVQYANEQEEENKS
jgi:hypothetical protein